MAVGLDSGWVLIVETNNLGTIVTLAREGPGMKARLHCKETGLFPEYRLPAFSKGQYLGIGDCLVLTITEDRYLPGLLPFQADCPQSPNAGNVHWTGGVSCQPWGGDLWYRIHPLFLRDIGEIMAGQRMLTVAGIISCVTGIVTERPYWLLEIPSLTRAVLLHLDQIVIVRRRKVWVPSKKEARLRSKTTRGANWQTASWTPAEVFDEPKNNLDAGAADTKAGHSTIKMSRA